MIDPLKLYTVVNADGIRTASSTMSSTAHQQEKEIGIKTNKVVPIVFIPGIMGTNLWNNRTKKSHGLRPTPILFCQALLPLDLFFQRHSVRQKIDRTILTAEKA